MSGGSFQGGLLLLLPVHIQKYRVEQPTLVDDTNRIMNAQRARGVDFGEGNLLKRIRSFIPILIPLFASSFKRADALAIAMEARGYKGGEGRTRYRTLQWGVKDTLALLVILCLMLIVFYLKNG